ncbi:roundabout homolog 1-like isoform X3 [Physella acuta]|uniref:roundabout homolog 1-like isoform X3 n=1 Tax=Physella acuta TaxID=109671 RepID=UPI0027DE0ED4|nr:roundabout homolog 1-like isoform X3 [Physella acuta]
MTRSSPWIRPLGRGRNGFILLWILLAVCCLAEEENPRIVEHPTDHYVARNEPAKLLCKAEGDPTPEITWYRNGQKVTTNKDDPSAHRLLLDNGNQLFFLRIIHSKTLKPDVGTYYCNATNIHGSAISRNATLQIAVLREDFRESPQPVTVAAGETAVFRCVPPRGEPEPKVMWHKDNALLSQDSRVMTSQEGSLTITSVKVSDAGKYTCIAINPGGEKESGPALLTVLEKPTFREMPDDMQANVNDTVELKCRSSGDPAPTIVWKREQGRIPHGRARTLEDGTLRIEKVQVADDGVYVCVAENTAGTVEAVGRLSVQTHPSFLISPKDLKVGRGRTAIMQCVVTGNPPPTVFWSKGKDPQLFFPNQGHGHLSVTDDGTLRIESVDFRDEGVYQCQALNALANSKVSATLTVIDQDIRLPPVIVVGPKNQTLEAKDVAMLSCQGEGQPPPAIRWFKDGKALPYNDPHYMFLPSGTLQISDLKLADSGVYMCKAISETGETGWAASLTVAKQGTYIIKEQYQSALPAAPSKLRVSDVADTSVHLTWISQELGQSPITGYVVEYFSPQTPQGWQLASDTVSREGYTVKDLLPATSYVFLVRAKNSAGLSPPSPVSDFITTREKRRTFAVNMPREEIVKELGALNIDMISAEPINASAIRIKWEVGTSLAAIEGYIINYTLVLELDPVKYGQSSIIKITDPYQFRSFITDLSPYSMYQVCVRAYARDVTSRCSKSMKVATKESIPTAPPENIVIHKEGDSIHVRWSPPPRQHQNGDIKGYDIYCMSEEHNNNCSTVASGSDSSVVIKKVDMDGSFRIKLAARTNKGRGTWSKDFVLGPEQTTIIGEPWFVWMLVGTIGGTLWLALCVFSIWLCRRRKRNKKKKMAQNGMYSAVPVHKSDESARSGAVVTREDVMYSHKDGNIHAAYGGLQSDLASLLECGHKDGLDGSQVYSSATSMPQLKTFYQRPGAPSSVAPYATTTLINKGGNSASRPSQTSAADSGFRPINHAYVHSSASGSGDSCQKPDMRSSDSNTDNSRPNTGHYSYAAGCPHEHCEGLVSPGSDSGSLTTDENGMPVKRNKYTKIGAGSCASCGQGKQPMVNWAELLPPPPEHPPPSELGSPADHSGECTLHRHNSNIAETRFMDNRSPISPVSKISSCSCPVPHDRMVPLLRPNIPYSELDYPTHPGSAHARYHSDMAGYQDGSGGSAGGGSGGSNYNSDRPYSPKQLNTMRTQTDMHRCQSPRSCHNCGSSLPQSTGPAPSSSSSSSSYNPHIHHHHPHHPDAFVTINQRPPCMGDLADQRGGVYPQVAGYPQGQVSAPFSQTGAGQCPYNPNYPYPPAALHGYRIPPIESNDQRNSSDLEQVQGRMYPPGHDGPHMDRACQSSLPSLGAGYGRRPESPTSEGVPDYAGESDMDVHRATDCHTPDSSVNGDGSLSGWPSQTDSDEVSHDEVSHDEVDFHEQIDDISSSSDSSFLADTDFASAVARAAELSGMTVVGTTVSDPKNSNNKKYRKHRAPPRAQSPYSTDSNMSAVVHKPYPKSERKKQLMEQGESRKYGQRKDGGMQDLEIEEGELDLPAYHRPFYPTLPLYHNNGMIRSGHAGDHRAPMLHFEIGKEVYASPTFSTPQPSTPTRSVASAATLSSTDIPII